MGNPYNSKTTFLYWDGPCTLCVKDMFGIYLFQGHGLFGDDVSDGTQSTAHVQLSVYTIAIKNTKRLSK